MCVCVSGLEVRGQPISTLQEARTTTDPELERKRAETFFYFTNLCCAMTEHILKLSKTEDKTAIKYICLNKSMVRTQISNIIVIAA